MKKSLLVILLVIVALVQFCYFCYGCKEEAGTIKVDRDANRYTIATTEGDVTHRSDFYHSGGDTILTHKAILIVHEVYGKSGFYCCRGAIGITAKIEKVGVTLSVYHIDDIKKVSDTTGKREDIFAGQIVNGAFIDTYMYPEEYLDILDAIDKHIWALSFSVADCASSRYKLHAFLEEL